MSPDRFDLSLLGEFVEIHNRFDGDLEFAALRPVLKHRRGLKRQHSLYDSQIWERYQQSGIPVLEDQFRSLLRMHDRAVTSCAWALRSSPSGAGGRPTRGGLEAYVRMRAAQPDRGRTPPHELRALEDYRKIRSVFEDASRELFHELLQTEWPGGRYSVDRNRLLRELEARLSGACGVLKHLTADHSWTTQWDKTPYRVSLFYVLWQEPTAVAWPSAWRTRGKAGAAKRRTLEAYRQARDEPVTVRPVPASSSKLFRWVDRVPASRSKPGTRRG